ncbi:type II toxin-antitoxin system VapB family antitoxin [Streptomyces sp. H27-D2]|uniref:type II toxin-antitoxin system VapB family antitoxin n=1 Tax=Streptomyces sp. H27-D2 TaxID=3046304 RepID=UPI002DB83915|nr:type II toxin-antitoxin system VapB family antitoxin [Streptomyces sp. H27-D2]MEC4020155.1 type II toxin-antitoxin system VapB family antitoxin [Streptomyces sp. H27-D2]
MTKLLVDIDDEALELAAKVFGTKTKKDTVNTALREATRRIQRARALAELVEMADRGDFDEFVGNKAAYRP